ncbi:MAG TPA: NAD(P)H-dependent glycerol-3-phosphate dehydrogenase [Polyangiaceae bacterium]|nr:NAD(P)H-dependent glycerol-3-phosphate dehydrogenase [Polyangiaceae bacterium]
MHGHVAVVGAGAWGSALSLALAERGPVRLFTWDREHARELAEARENRAFLPGFALPPGVEPTADLAHALGGAELVVVALPSQAVRDVLARARDALPDVPLVLASKGIESGSFMLLTEVVADVLGPEVARRALVLSGPSFALEVARRLPTNLVVAAQSHELSVTVQNRMATERLRIYSSDDPIGVEVGGALKNVIAIAAGACDGLGFGYNTRAALITRGLAEMARLAAAKGGNVRTLAGLAGLGDLVLTCTGELSRNRTVGVELGRGARLEDVLSGLGHVAEGVPTAEAAHRLAERFGVELPISSEVYRVLYEGKPVLDAVHDVLHRPLKPEW